MRPSRHSATYQFDVPTLEVRESEILQPQKIGGWQCHTAMSASPCLNLTQASPVIGTSAINTKNPGVAGGLCSESRKVRMLDRTFHILQEVGQIHTVNIQRSLTHRIEIAKQRGDQNLLNALESESKAIALL